MWQAIEFFLRKLDRWRFQYNVEGSLALHRRAEVRRDGLSLLRAHNRLEIRWRARDIHPWDTALQPENRAERFAGQLLSDTEDAIVRLFEAFPQVDVIDLRVFEPSSDTVMLLGRVPRSALTTVRNVESIRMRLLLLGVKSSSPGLELNALRSSEGDETSGSGQRADDVLKSHF